MRWRVPENTSESGVVDGIIAHLARVSPALRDRHVVASPQEVVRREETGGSSTDNEHFRSRLDRHLERGGDNIPWSIRGGALGAGCTQRGGQERRGTERMHGGSHERRRKLHDCEERHSKEDASIR